MPGDFTCFLFDNGSIRPDSTRSLRTLAGRMRDALDCEVRPVSLLHSTRISAEELDGVPAQLLEPALDAWLGAHPDGIAILLPLFFGPSGALIDYVPERMASLAQKHPQARMVLADPLVLPHEDPVELVAILAEKARRATLLKGWSKPKVVLCDHGTPLASVTAVRNRLGELLANALRDDAAEVCVASMERREGDAYAFNEPLLETRLRTAPYDAGQVVVLLQFLSPGRHAGPGGDIAEICASAEKENPELQTTMSDPIADDPRLVSVLVRRAKAARAKLTGAAPAA